MMPIRLPQARPLHGSNVSLDGLPRKYSSPLCKSSNAICPGFGRVRANQRDMRVFAGGKAGLGDDNWESKYFRKTPDDKDRENALDYDDLMNTHLHKFSNVRKLGPNGSEGDPEKGSYCMVFDDENLANLMKHLDQSVRFLDGKEIHFFLKHQPTKDLLLQGENGFLPKLTVADQTCLRQTLQEVLQIQNNNLENEGFDPRSHVLLLREGSTLEQARAVLNKHYLVPLSTEGWRDFTSCIPHQDEIISKHCAINTAPLFDFCMQKAIQSINTNLASSKMKLIYRWMVAGQKSGIFNESDVVETRVKIIADSKDLFYRALEGHRQSHPLSPEARVLVKVFGEPMLERTVLEDLFAAEAVDVKFDLDEFSGSKAFSDWFNKTSPGILKFCDRSQPISIVSPSDEGWSLVDARSEALPIVKVKPQVTDRQLLDFLLDIGGEIMQSSGSFSAMTTFDTRARINTAEDTMHSIAGVRSRVVSGFIGRLLLQPEVAMAREFYGEVRTQQFPKNVQRLAKLRYENAVRGSVEALFEQTKRPMILFAVPKLHEFLKKIIEFSLNTDVVLDHYMKGDRSSQTPIEALLERHLDKVDRN